MRNIDLIIKLLSEISKMKEVEDIELINIPEDVDADIGLKIKPKNIKDRYKILEKLNDLEWEIYETLGILPIIYWEFENQDKIKENKYLDNP